MFITDFSKEAQLSKNRTKNPNKMSKIEKELYIDFIREKSNGICQIPNCNNAGQDIAHKDRAYKREDRFVALICRNHHTIADQPNPRQIDESSRVNLELSAISRRNWKDYLGII